MEYEEYYNQTHQAAQLIEAGEYEQAIAIFRSLLSSDISDIDKSIMCVNIGVVLEKMGRDQKALESYEQGMSYEEPYSRSFVAETRAHYLYRLGRLKESLRAYEELSSRPSLTEEEKARIKTCIAALWEQLE